MAKATTRAILAETVYGRVRGYSSDEVNIFLGIRYAKAERFQMPETIKPWTGIQDALGYGFRCPTPIGPQLAGDETMMPLRFWPDSENCHFLNIWTQGVGDGGKRPVMVWIHGGGYAAGSAMEHMYYDGWALCQCNDVVVVSINHRLNILGYLDLSCFSEKYYNSGNLGNADIVAALEWLRDNIAFFGGDPENVTIFGQSGGGNKVRDIMQTPAADGLYHRAIVQSGVIASLAEAPCGRSGKAVVMAMMKQLGIDQAEDLEKIPYQALARAHAQVAPDLMRHGEYIGGSPLPNSWFPGDALAVGFNPYSLGVPTLVGTTFAEFSYTLSPDNKYEMRSEEKEAFLRTIYGKRTHEVIELFRRTYPEKDLCDAAIVDRFMRRPTLDYALKKADVSSAPVYLYLYAYETSMGHTAAWHLGEIPFVFRNTRMVPRLIEEGVSDQLEDRMANAWTAFARTGNPWHPDLPSWPSSSGTDDYTMIFDRQLRIGKNFDRQLQEYMGLYFPQSIVTAAVGTTHADELSKAEQMERAAEMQRMIKDSCLKP